MLVDEVKLKAIAPAQPEGKGQMIANGGFEDGLAGWSTGQGQVVEGSNCHTGICGEFRPARHHDAVSGFLGFGIDGEGQDLPAKRLDSLRHK